MKAKTPKLLTRLRLKAVSLVDDGANPQAVVTFFKRADMKKDEEVLDGKPKNFKDPGASFNGEGADEDKPFNHDKPKEPKEFGKKKCSKCMKEFPPGADKCPKCGDKMEKGKTLLDRIEDEEDRAAVEALQNELASLKAVQKKAPKAEDEILKGLNPEARELVEKARNEASEARKAAALVTDAIEKMRDEEVTKGFIAKASEFNRLSLDPKRFGSILKSVYRLSTEDGDELVKVLSAANAAAKPLFTVVGKGGSGVGTGTAAIDQLRAKAEEITKSNPEVKLGDALQKACNDNPELYKRYSEEVAERRVRVAVGEDE